MISIREETKSDLEAIRKINELAFGQQDEAILVNKLRKTHTNTISLVAIQNEEIVGHILFSPVTISNDDRQITGMGLGPMAVLPDYQKQNIGSTLVQEGLRRLTEQNCPFVVVLGHPKYYPRFGFVPASKYDVRCEWDVPDEVFMIQVFGESVLSGLAQYLPEFSELD